MLLIMCNDDPAERKPVYYDGSSCVEWFLLFWDCNYIIFWAWNCRNVERSLACYEPVVWGLGLISEEPSLNPNLGRLWCVELTAIPLLSWSCCHWSLLPRNGFMRKIENRKVTIKPVSSNYLPNVDVLNV